METIKKIEKGCGEDMINFKYGELQQDYWAGKKYKVLYCGECNIKLKMLKEFVELIKEMDNTQKGFARNADEVQAYKDKLKLIIEG